MSPASGPGDPEYGTVSGRALPDYAYDGSDPVEKLVYRTEIQRDLKKENGHFLIESPQIVDTAQEGGLLKVFYISYGTAYLLWDSGKVTGSSAWCIPVAATYQEQSGNYALKKYEMPQDGDDLYAKSIRAFCTTPATGKEIAGLADRMMKMDFPGLKKHHDANLQKYLDQNGISVE